MGYVHGVAKSRTGLEVALVIKNLLANAGDIKRCGFHSWVRKIPWRRVWQPTSVILPGEILEQRSLAGYSPQGHTQSDRTKVT